MFEAAFSSSVARLIGLPTSQVLECILREPTLVSDADRDAWEARIAMLKSQLAVVPGGHVFLGPRGFGADCAIAVLIDVDGAVIAVGFPPGSRTATMDLRGRLHTDTLRLAGTLKSERQRVFVPVIVDLAARTGRDANPDRTQRVSQTIVTGGASFWEVVASALALADQFAGRTPCPAG